jgi:hypothetical protein
VERRVPAASVRAASDAVAGATSKNSPTSAITNPTTNVVPRMTICSFCTGHADRDTEMSSVGSTESPVTRNAKNTQLISRCGSRQWSYDPMLGNSGSICLST